MSDTDKTSDPAAPEAKKNLPYKYIDHAWKDAAFLGYSDLLQVCLPSDAYEKLSFSSEFKFYTDYYLPTLLSGYSIKDALFADVVMEIPLKANPFGPPIIMLVEFQDYLSKKFTKRFMDSMIRLRALHPYSEIGGLAIFTGKVPNENSAFIGTDEFGIIITKFNSYHLMSHSLDELRADPRPFCKVFYAGRLAADESKTVEEKAREIFTEMREARKLISTNKATLTENQIMYHHFC
jgi:hypothetical protein